MEKRTKKYLKLLLKLVLTSLALFFVFKKVPFREVSQVIFQANYALLFVALLLFVISKVVASFRLNVLFNEIGIKLSEWKNLQLYWLGMFYNMFLPGGIGGDGYKLIVLKNRFQQENKSILAALLIDRLSGLLALSILVSVLYFFVPEQFNIPRIVGVVLGGIGVGGFYFLGSKIYSKLSNVFGKIFSFSMLVQGAQLLCAAIILKGLGLDFQLHSGYLFLFLISSVVSVIPLTVGGVGARELTFTIGAPLLGLNVELALSLSLLFYAITAITSFMGVYYSIKPIQWD